ncbi:response regulator transcription factor [Niastella vici]|nr:response regulator transcription factor [Niastella vici]
METIRIALVDDQQLFRRGIALLMSENPDFRIVLQAANGNDCLRQLAEVRELPHIALVDMEMPEVDGIGLNVLLKERYPSVKVIILSVHEKQRLIARMIEAGASGYLFKNCDPEELTEAIYSTYRNGFYINQQVLKAIQHASSDKNKSLKSVNNIPIELTRREEEILRLICGEQSNAEIAGQLFISVRTVEGHRNNLLLKTGCQNTAGLVLFAVKYGIYEIDF